MHSEITGSGAHSYRGAAFGEFLVSQGLLRPDTLRQALDTQQTMGGRLDTVLLDLGLVSEPALLDALGEFYSTRTVSQDELAHASPEVVRMVSPRMAERLELVPFRHEGRTLHIATLNPGDLLVEDELSLLTDCVVTGYVALEVRLYEALHRLYAVQPSMQIVSVLDQLRGEPAPEAPPALDQPPAPAAGAEPVPELVQGTATDLLVAMGGEPPRGEDSMALEISQEDLEQFPSLRTGTAGEPPEQPRLHARPPDEKPTPVGHDDRLQAASISLQNVEMREDIADTLLTFCRPILRRRLLLAVRDDVVIGWRGDGEGIDHAVVRDLAIPLSEPSVFVGLSQGSEFWLGPLPKMPRNSDLVRALGGVPPAECIILPLIVRSKTVCFLYGDNVEQPVSGLPISQLRRLVAKASLAFQVYLLKSKIRNL